MVNSGGGWLRSAKSLKRACGLAGISILLAASQGVAGVEISGQSDTMFRLMKQLDGSKTLPAYEYLRLSVMNIGDEDAVSFHMGGWGRVDTNDGYLGDLQYGYLNYRSAKNNFSLSAGRQLVTEGIVAERIDGFSLRTDLAAGFGASAFVGGGVNTEPNFKGPDTIYGGRISHSMPKLYTLGLSAMEATGESTTLRKEYGADLWLHPLKMVDLTGRSSYNAETSDWMEHTYLLSVTPLQQLTIDADFSRINYEDFFYHVTTSALALSPTQGLLDPKEEMTATGVAARLTPITNLQLLADYKHYEYKIAGSADYFGGRLGYALPGNFSAGASFHRMDGDTDKLRYYEYRAYCSKKIDKADLTLDFIDHNYDAAVNGEKNAFSVTAAAAYEVSENFKVSADLDYGQNPDFDNETKAFVKLTYLFSSKQAAEGGAKSEK